MREVEVKAHVDDWKALKEKIDELYGKSEDVNKSDLYFALPGEIHQALRIRNNKGVLELTTKRMSSDSLSEDNIEYEVITDISQEQTAIGFFECLGYEKYFRKIKSGWEWMIDSIHVELMEVLGYSYREKGEEKNVGWFLELEILLPPSLKIDLREKQKSLYDLLSRLGISEDRIETRSYRSMILGELEMEFRAQHILVKDKETAEKLYERIRKGENFSSLAHQYSTCPSKEKGGDLGWFKEGQMVPQFEREVRRMGVGSISHPVRTQFGYHIIKKTGVRD